jgi:nitronate monooxygenase
VIAAGGVYTGADIRKFLKLGAAGVQMATRFVATHECDASPAFKQAYVNASKEDIVIINSPVGLPGRAINNEFLEAVKRGEKVPFTCPYQCIRTCDHRKSPYCIALALIQAKRGNLKRGFVFSGQNAYRVDRIVSVKELIKTLKQEYGAAQRTHAEENSLALPLAG